MPVDFQQIRNRIKEYGRKTLDREEEMREQCEHAAVLLRTGADGQDQLLALARKAAEKNSGLRCAFPTAEPIVRTYPCPPEPPSCVILAADGSQINPSRHDAIPFGVINVGAFRVVPGGGGAPGELVRSEIMLYQDLNSGAGMVTEDIVALRRDLSERKFLAELASREAPPVIALTDGPLELYRETSKSEEFAQAFSEYLAVLGSLAHLGVSTAGYVDRPGSDLVVRLLELLDLPGDRLAEAGLLRSLPRVVDADLFRETLPFGHRTALFAIHSRSASHFSGELALHFFYLNAGSDLHPSLARVEVPAWVAATPALLDALHAVLVSQCRQLGARPYPYVLHRAHEVALVSQDEKKQLEMMIALELTRPETNPAQRSNKQTAKVLAGRMRYKP